LYIKFSASAIVALATFSIKVISMRCFLIASFLTLSAGSALAQSNSENIDFEAWRSHAQKSIDAAVEQARKRTVDRGSWQPAQFPEPQPTPGKRQADIGSLASQFQNDSDVKLMKRAKLLVFVSTSMPPAALKRIGEDLVKLDGVMMLRGIRGPLGVKNALHETMQFLEPAAKTGVSIQIDPASFKRYGITQVPAVLFDDFNDSCGKNQCELSLSVVYGDVTLAFALEEMLKMAGPAAALAESSLAKLKGYAR